MHTGARAHNTWEDRETPKGDPGDLEEQTETGELTRVPGLTSTRSNEPDTSNPRLEDQETRAVPPGTP